MFDPFGDSKTAGYLRNVAGENDLDIVKHLEHDAFARNMPDALTYLAKRRSISYSDFCHVHRLLFSEVYPWAGQDRSVTAPDLIISKGPVVFCQALDIERAINEGLRISKTQAEMSEKPGLVMGMFAYGHPFLDGNGRTLLLIHLELCYRAGISIDWAKTNKKDYLKALTQEIEDPNNQSLDKYLSKFKKEKQERKHWGETVLSIDGLSGLDNDNSVEGRITDKNVADIYQEFEKKRQYSYLSVSKINCKVCNAIPCTCYSLSTVTKRYKS